MNLNDKNIDQIFRDAAQNSSAPRYDHSYWNEMNSILNDQNKRKRGVILWSVAGAFVAVLLVSTLFVLNNTSSKSQLASNASPSKDETLAKNTLKDKSLSENISLSNNKEQNVEVKEVNLATNETIQQNATNSADGLQKTHFGYKAKSEKPEKNHTPQTEINVSKKAGEASIQTKHTNDQEFSMKNTIAETDDRKDKTLNNVELSTRIISMQHLEAERELIPFKLPKQSPFNYYAKISAGLMENYETSRPFESGVFDLSLNLEYQKEQVLIRSGIGFQATSNADLVVSERAKVYGFGITTHQNNLSYQSLYDLYIPIELGYTLNNTSFGFGAQVNYLLGTTMNYESLENKVIVDEYKIKGFSEGLNTLTAQGYVWLEQKLTDRFAAGVKVGTNLNSRIKEGKYFNESATTNPLYGQLTLRYNIIK